MYHNFTIFYHLLLSEKYPISSGVFRRSGAEAAKAEAADSGTRLLGLMV
jgi:hypothetical protein